MRLAPVLAALALLPAVPALAQYEPQGRVVSERLIVERRGGPPVAYQSRPQNACVPWCSGDNNPCDPPEFKAADGRCFNDNR
jgi:hypothetical protein